jgi:hypothetical protein
MLIGCHCSDIAFLPLTFVIYWPIFTLNNIVDDKKKFFVMMLSYTFTICECNEKPIILTLKIYYA